MKSGSVLAEAGFPPDAPADKPQPVTQAGLQAYEAAIAPYVAVARETWPAARRRFLGGLPRGHVLFVTTRLYDAQGRWESAFIRVRSIRKGMIGGQIATQLQLVKTYKPGDAYSFREEGLLDWMISKPDGTEEGNVVGKFLDTYQPHGERP